MIKYENHRGTVDFDQQVFGLIAMDTALRMEEIHAVTNARGKIMRMKDGGRESLNFIEVQETGVENCIDLRMYIVIYFGKSISESVNKLGEALRRRIGEITGMTVRDIYVNVTGVKSRKIARRELEIKC